MTNKDWRFSYHARYEAWEERFSEYDIKDAINRSVPFGGQYGTDMLYHDSVSNAVFAVTKDGWVKTVLTYDYAVANMMVLSNLVSKLDFVKPNENKSATLPNKIHHQSVKDLSVGGIVDRKCFQCAKYIYDTYTKEKFESTVKFMCTETKKALVKFGLRSKQYKYEWSKVNEYLYKLWNGEISEYNDIRKKEAV